MPVYAPLQLQQNLANWLTEAFGEETLMDPKARAIRVLEEAVELVQAVGIPESKALEQLRHTYSRPVGEPAQEVAGVINGALMTAQALGENGLRIAEEELFRARRNIDAIRVKNLFKVQA